MSAWSRRPRPAAPLIDVTDRENNMKKNIPKHEVQWIQNVTGKQCSTLGATVAQVLAEVADGIEKAPINPAKINWQGKSHVEVIWKSPLASGCSSELAKLLICCGQRGLRLVLTAVAPGLMRMTFSRHDDGGPCPDDQGHCHCEAHH